MKAWHKVKLKEAIAVTLYFLFLWNCFECSPFFFWWGWIKCWISWGLNFFGDGKQIFRGNYFWGAIWPGSYWCISLYLLPGSCWVFYPVRNWLLYLFETGYFTSKKLGILPIWNWVFYLQETGYFTSKKLSILHLRNWVFYLQLPRNPTP